MLANCFQMIEKLIYKTDNNDYNDQQNAEA